MVRYFSVAHFKSEADIVFLKDKGVYDLKIQENESEDFYKT